MRMYFAALVLPRAYNEEILRFKHRMLEKFGCRVALRSPAHITILPPFWMEAEKETGFLQDMDLFSSQQPVFEITTNGFSAFVPRTLFIAVLPNKSLDWLKQKADQFFQERPSCPIKKEARPFHPHITIATRDLHKKSFEEAWALFGEEEYRKTWTADALSVLRHDRKEWEVMHRSPFVLP